VREGSELHVFRGHQPSPTGFIMGERAAAAADKGMSWGEGS